MGEVVPEVGEGGRLAAAPAADSAKNLVAARDLAGGLAGADHGAEPIWVSTELLRARVRVLMSAAETLEQLATQQQRLLELERSDLSARLSSGPIAMPFSPQLDGFGYAQRALAKLGPLGPRLGVVSGQLRLLGQLLLAGLLEYEGAETSIRMLFDPAEAERVRRTAGNLGWILLSPLATGVTVAKVAEAFAGFDGWGDPRSVMQLRRLVSLSDDAFYGLAGVRPDPAAVHAAEQAGLSVLTLVAAGLRSGLTKLSDGRFGLLRRTTVQRRARAATAAPHSVTELIKRIPQSEHTSAQLRIDQYTSASGQPQWVVYLGGTVVAPEVPELEPFDMSSNLRLMAKEQAASLEAATTAMQRAGVASGDPVLVVGYSQGGLIAANLIERGDYNVQGLVTVGSPIGHLRLDPELPVLAFEHRDDVVPALSGIPADHSDAARTVVSTRAYAAGAAPADTAVPAHALDAYAATAARYERGLSQTSLPGPATTLPGQATALPGGIQDALSQLQGEGTAQWYQAKYEAAAPDTHSSKLRDRMLPLLPMLSGR